MTDIIVEEAPVQALSDISIDPAEVATGRTELLINAGEIRVAPDGPDWGDAAIEQYLADAARGQVPVDFRVPNRVITIPLLVGAMTKAGYPVARQRLQAKVGLLQEEQRGWLRRGIGRYCDVVNASLKWPDRTTHLGVDADVILTLEALPEFYGDEIELADNVADGEHELVFQHAAIMGDYPGRVRVVVDNDSDAAQLGLLVAIRARHYDPASTAAPVYAATDLTPLDATAIVSDHLEHDAIRQSWTGIMGTDLLGDGPLTHTGTYRVWARVASETVPPWLRFVWGVGDLVNPSENAQVTFLLGGPWYDVDLGEIRLDPSPVGVHRWKGQLEARSADGSLGNLWVHRLWLVPVDEGYTVIRAPQRTQVATERTAFDNFDDAAGDDPIDGRTAQSGDEWTVLGNDPEFFVIEDVNVPVGGQPSVIGASCTAAADITEGRYALLGSDDHDSVQLDQSVYINTEPSTDGMIVETGWAARFIDGDNHLRALIRRDWPSDGSLVRSLVLTTLIGGAEHEIGSAPLPVLANLFHRLRLAIYTNGFARLELLTAQLTVIATAIGYSDELLPGGALETGQAGPYDRCKNTGPILRIYDDVSISVIPPLDAVMYPNRSVEVRTDGVYRENIDGSAHGQLIPQGDLLRIPPSGVDERTIEVFVKPSRGNFAELPDTGIDDVSARVTYRPSWLFPPP